MSTQKGGGARRWSFADVVADELSYELRVAGLRVEIDRKPLEVLFYLLQNAGAVVRKDQLAEAVWPKRVLSDAVLDKTLSRVREALGKGGQGAIETVRGVGWRLVAPVRADAARARPVSVPNNLSAHPSSLIGREALLGAARERLFGLSARLLTLTGCGGIGKTTLSLSLAADVAADFPDGVYFVDLAPLRRGELMVSAIAQVLQVREAGRQPLLESVKDHLRDKRLLLVLDNFEQVMAAAATVAELLAACPSIRIVVTSREALNLRGEHELEVPGLRIPAAGAVPSPQDAERFSAIALFAQRARMVKPDFELTEEIAADVAAICRRLDGLPLAIELAAARSKLFGTRALLERLGQRFDFLRDGPRDLPERQQTLWATVDWSYELLDANEQRLLLRLAVFSGSFNQAAAEAVCAGGPLVADDIFRLLGRLVDKSLLGFEDFGQPGRYRMLETIRAYALARLMDTDERVAVRDRHLDWLLDLATRANAHLHFFLADAQMAAFMPQVAVEHGNLRGALEWSNTHAPATVRGLALVTHLHWYWMGAGHINESVAWLRQLLARVPGDAPLRAEALVVAANLAVEQGGGDESRSELLAFARESLHAALAEWRQRGDRAWTSYALASLAAYVVTIGGDPAEAGQYVDEGLALAREIGDGWLVSYLTHFVGRATLAQEKYSESAAAFTESIAAVRELGGNRLGEGYGTWCLGRIARLQGKLNEAARHHRDALRLFSEDRHLQGIAFALNGLGGVAAQQAQADRAAKLLCIVAHWRASSRIFLEPDAELEHQQDLARVSTALGVGAFDEVLATVGSITDEQAVVFGLEAAA